VNGEEAIEFVPIGISTHNGEQILFLGIQSFLYDIQVRLCVGKLIKLVGRFDEISRV
jgi:hypothetical protein